MLRCLFLSVIFSLISLPGYAAISTLGRGESLRLDPAGLPPEMKAANTVMQAKCVHCHSLERIIIAVTTGVAPISGRPFDRAAVHTYGQKMIRKLDSHMTKDEVSKVENLLIYLINKDVPRKP